jgi:hypothetical protein
MSNLCTLADVKTYLGITDTNSDAVLTAMVTNVSALIESYCNRTFASTAYVETRNGTGGMQLFMRQGPVISVSAVSIDGIAQVPAPTPTTLGYIVDEDTIWLRNAAFTRGIQNVTVSYTAGYGSIPADVIQSCIEVVAYHYAKRTRIDKSSETLGTAQTISFSQADLPASAKTALKQRVWWIA